MKSQFLKTSVAELSAFKNLSGLSSSLKNTDWLNYQVVKNFSQKAEKTKNRKGRF
jgi:hypothetical protein